METIGDWIIQCRFCQIEREATYNVNLGEFTCTKCGAVHDEEDTTVFNKEEALYYSKLFLGAKVAGMMEEPEFKGDKEQQRRERW